MECPVLQILVAMDRGYSGDQWYHGRSGGRGRWRGRGGYYGNREDTSGGGFGGDDSFDNQNSPYRDHHGRHAKHQWNKGRYVLYVIFTL